MPVMTRMLLSTLPMMRGDDVLGVQRALVTLGASLTTIGVFGLGTATAVRTFQDTRHLETDGIVGPATWKALFGDATVSVPLDPLAENSLTALTVLHGRCADSCKWRLDRDGILVESERITFSQAERNQASRVLTGFRREILAALTTNPVLIESIVACICAESGGQPACPRLDPGCDRSTPENTPSRVSEGLMQTLLSTAREALKRDGLRLAELQRPEVSVLAGTIYIAQQSHQTRFDPPLVAAAYNAGSLRYNGSSSNRWRLLQYPIGTSRHVDRFLRSFNAVMSLVDTQTLPAEIPSFRRMLASGVSDGVTAEAATPAPDAPGTSARQPQTTTAGIHPANRSSGASAGLVGRITEIASTSKVAHFKWADRGRAPAGYVKGMALVFARVCCKLQNRDPVAIEIVQVKRNDIDDVLVHYDQTFHAAGLNNDGNAEDRLRHLFVLMIGHGMRESSGQYGEGRDTTATSPSPETAEAGLFQTSYDLRESVGQARPILDQLFETYKEKPLGFVEVFREGAPDESEDFGSGPGAEFQRLSKRCPAFAAEFAAVGYRHRHQHWGPLSRREVELNEDCDTMLQEIQDLVANSTNAGAQLLFRLIQR